MERIGGGMGLKSIEMQVALPRTQDSGKIQEQVHKQGEHVQSTLTASQLKEDKIKRNRIQELENTNSFLEKNESDTLKQDVYGKQSGGATSRHPFLGRRIDFNG